MNAGGQVFVGDDNADFGSGMYLVVSSTDPLAGGDLVVRHGSTITNSGAAVIGVTESHTGVATVTGAGSTWSRPLVRAGTSPT